MSDYSDLSPQERAAIEKLAQEIAQKQAAQDEYQSKKLVDNAVNLAERGRQLISTGKTIISAGRTAFTTATTIAEAIPALPAIMAIILGIAALVFLVSFLYDPARSLIEYFQIKDVCAAVSEDAANPMQNCASTINNGSEERIFRIANPTPTD